MRCAAIFYERSQLQAKWDEVFDHRQMLGHGSEGGRVRFGSSDARREAKVKPRASGDEEGEVKPRILQRGDCIG